MKPASKVRGALLKHASAPALQALEPLLVALRSIPALVERRPGIFYFRSTAFLHFHEDPAGLFADARLDLAEFTRRPVNTTGERKALLRAVETTVNATSARKMGA